VVASKQQAMAKVFIVVFIGGGPLVTIGGGNIELTSWFDAVAV